MLKRYASIRDIVKDLRKLRKSTRQIIANELENDDDTPHTIIPQLNIRQGGGQTKVSSLPPPGQRFRAQPQLKRQHERDINKSSKKLDALLQQQQSINHIAHLLQTDFANSDTANIDRMRQIAKRISEDVKRHVEISKEELGELSQQHAPKILYQLANSVNKKLQEMYGKQAKDSEVVSLAGIVNGIPQYTVYLVYHNLKNDVGYIFPNKIYALSLYDGKLYLDATEPTLKPPGQFRRGVEINIHEKQLATTTQDVIRRIQAQMTVDNNVSHQSGIAPPFSAPDVKLQTIRHVTDFEIKPNHTMIVRIDKKAGNPAAASEVLNNVQIHLNSAMLMANPKSKVRIIRTEPKATKDGYIATLKFVPGGRWSGKTLDQEIVDNLRQMGIPEHHINRFRQIREED